MTDMTEPHPEPETDPTGTEASTPTQRHRFSMDDLPDLRETHDSDSGVTPAHEQAEFTTVYDAIDAMERMLNEAKGSIFSPTAVKIDRDDFLEQLQSLKSMLPVQLERASALMREAERRLADAQSQANVIITSAQSRAADMVRDANEQVRFMASQENVTQLAREKARSMLDKAQSKSDHLTQGADRYCIGVMNDLEEQLHKLERDVQAGLKVLEDRQQKAAEQLPRLDEGDYPDD